MNVALHSMWMELATAQATPLRLRAALAVATCVGLAACATAPTTMERLATMPPAVDAPYQLASDADLAEVRALFEAMPAAAEGRDERRRRLAEEYARRIDRGLRRGDRETAFGHFRALLTLWSAAELATGAPELAAYSAQAEAIRRTFSRTGGDIQVVTALAALERMHPQRQTALVSEMQEIFAYSDDLATSRYGEGAERARPIKILEDVARSIPSALVVDNLIALYRTRQKALSALFQARGPDIELFKAHGEGVLRTSWNIVRYLARAGRVSEAAAAISDLRGIGDDPTLRPKLAALERATSPAPYLALAGSFRGETEDLEAALTLALEAVDRYPKEPSPYFAAADAARAKDSIPLAIRLYEAGIALAPIDAAASASLADLYEFRVTSLAFSDRPNAAKKQLARFENFHAAASRRLDRPLHPDLANAYAAMGRGLISLGELGAAQDYFDRSLSLRPTSEALEYLGTLALRRDNFAAATAFFERALILPVKEPSERYDRIKLMRLAGEAHVGAGRAAKGSGYLVGALGAWQAFSKRYELGKPLLAQSLLEQAKILWLLEQRETSMRAFDAAATVGGSSDDGGGSLYADVVSSLITRGEYRQALDIFHAALGSDDIDDYYKVYMSLWMLAEAERRRTDPDPFASAFLKGRDGGLWYDVLARYAVGEASLEALEALATTRGRRAELWYYTATLGRDGDAATRRQLLREVVASDMVLFFEYEMAKAWLAERPPASP